MKKAPVKAAEPAGFLPEAPERPSLTVDIVVFALLAEALQVLLIERGAPPFEGCDALPGGFVRAKETVESAAARELEEETSLSGLYLEQLRTFSDPARDPRGRVVSVAHIALVPADRAAQLEPHGGTDARAARWVPLAELQAKPGKAAKRSLAFDHGLILQSAVDYLRDRVAQTTIAFRLLPSEFTLTEAQRVFEIVLGRAIDKVSFRRRMEALELLAATNKMRRGAHRPARLYRVAAHNALQI